MKEVIQILKTKFTPEEIDKLIPVLAEGIETMLYDIPLSRQWQEEFEMILKLNNHKWNSTVKELT